MKHLILPIPLPIVVLSFCVPNEDCDAELLEKKWEAYDNSEKESKLVYKFKEEYDAEGVADLFENIGFAAVEDASDDDNKTYAAGVFTTSSMAKGKPATVPLFAYFEFNSKGSVRVTVRAINGSVAKAAGEAIKAIIAK